MSKLQRTNRYQYILDATLALVAEEGLLKTSMSKIFKRSKSSPGVVYHYFSSKDEIMDTLFLRITSEMMAQIMGNVDPEQAILVRYKDLWLKKYHFHFNNPDKTIFLEQYKNSSYFSAEREQQMQQIMMGLLSMGQRDIERGLVVPLGLDVIYTMTFTVALNLAKLHIDGEITLDATILDAVAERSCQSILL
ncbi:MAG: TetR/AcrR family transcriptional regulator [Chloroflexota bacterium]